MPLHMMLSGRARRGRSHEGVGGRNVLALSAVCHALNIARQFKEGTITPPTGKTPPLSGGAGGGGIDADGYPIGVAAP
eukprot:387661-Amphidinium_carterae.1